jgi:voltage-gated potassium channel
MAARSRDDIRVDQDTAPIGLHRRIYEILEVRAPGDGWARLVEVGLTVMIIANVVAIILQSMHAVDAAYHRWFRAFEAISIAVFTAEYALRVWSSVENERSRRRGALGVRLR